MIVDVIVPSYRGIGGQFQQNLSMVSRHSSCKCGDHLPWECDRGKHSIYLHPHSETCVIHWGRNALVSLFLHAQTLPDRPPADYCLMLDDDMLLEPHHLERLLSHRKDVVVGICTVRRDPPMPTIYRRDPERGIYEPVIEWNWNSQKLIEVDAAGAACMLIKREVLENMKDAYIKCLRDRAQVREALARWNTPLSVMQEVEKDFDVKSEKREKLLSKAIAEGDHKAACFRNVWFEFMKDFTGGENGEFGEDLSFCVKLKQLGYKIFADPQVLPGHLGEYAYSVHDYIWKRESEKASVLPRPEEKELSPTIN